MIIILTINAKYLHIYFCVPVAFLLSIPRQFIYPSAAVSYVVIVNGSFCFVMISSLFLIPVSRENYTLLLLPFLGPVVQSVVSLTSSLRVISLTVLADSIHNNLIFLC